MDRSCDQTLSRPATNALLKLLPQNIYWKNVDGTYLGCNAAMSSILGLASPAEIVGKTLEDLLGVDFDKTIEQNDLKVFSEQKPLLAEEKLVDHAGRKLTYLSQKVPMFDDNGNITGLLGISFNITEQKRLQETLYRDKKEIENDINKTYAAVTGNKPTANHENKEKLDSIKGYFENIIALMPGNVFWQNKEGVYLGCNDNVAKILGLSSRHDIVGKTNIEFMSHQLAEEAKKNDQIVINDARPIAFEEKGFNAEGEEAYYFSRKVPLLDKNKNVAGLLGMSLDITELKKKEAALSKALEDAKAADKLKTHIINNISHDIRTPLNGIIQPSSILHERQENLDDMQRELIDAIYVSSHRLADLIEHILDFGRIKSGRFQLSLGPVDLSKLLRLVVDNINSFCRKKELNFIIDYPPEVVRHIISDSSCITQILLNLLSNAIQHTSKGHVLARFREVIHQDGSLWLQCEIEDTGTGIPADKIKDIFGEFHKLADSSSTNQRNYGLGLAIVRELVNLLDGEINVISEVGKGSTFQVLLPVTEAETVNPIITWQSCHPDTKVLIIDNNLEEASAYIHQLIESSFDVYPSQAAINELENSQKQNKPYMVVAVDRNIDEDCSIYIRKIKENISASDILFILLTPLVSQKEMLQYQSAGYDAIIMKPFLPEEFHAQLINAWQNFKS